MFVAERMTKHPVSVTSNATIGDVDRLMKKHNFHRMIVIDDGKLVGYLSDRDIMQTNVITVGEDATIEEAALIMYQNKVGGLPVISEVGAVVGIITATDILKTFVDVMGLPRGGKIRVTLSVNNEIGTVAAITKIFADNGVNLDSVITCTQDGKRYELVVRFDDRSQGFDEVKRQLEIHGYKVIHVAKIG